MKPQNLQVIWNVQFITIFIPAWMIPPVYHSLRRESIKDASSASKIGVQSVRPTWFEDFAVSKGPAPPTDQGEPQPMDRLKLVIKEEALPLKEQPEFPALHHWLYVACSRRTHGNANERRSALRQQLMSHANAFMAFARSLHTFNCSKKMNCKYNARLSERR